MGLDMYLTADKSISRMAYDNKLKGKLINWLTGVSDPRIQVADLTYDVIQWRKANAIHGWFVRNCQDGEDDGRRYQVSRDQLAELHAICQRVLSFKGTPRFEAKAKLWLPIMEGFFFGSEEYDEWYIRNLEDTVTALEHAAKCKGLADCDFYYQADW